MAATSNVSLGHAGVNMQPLHSVERTLVLANSLGGSLEAVVYKMYWTVMTKGVNMHSCLLVLWDDDAVVHIVALEN
jgi:hypothetical protein